MGHHQTWQVHVLCHRIQLRHRQNLRLLIQRLRPIQRRLQRILLLPLPLLRIFTCAFRRAHSALFVGGEEIRDAISKLVLDNLVPQQQLLLKVLDIIVTLFYVEFCPIFLSFDIYLFHVQFMLLLQNLELFF